MVFSSPLFLFLFLPIVLSGYFVVPRSWRNYWLLTSSLVFYAWGEVVYVWVMLVSIVLNYLFGLWVDRVPRGRQAQIVIALAVAANLGLLIAFKYANFLVDNLNVGLGVLHLRPIHLAPVHLPIGISFFTFQAMSYVIDVYRREVPAQKSVANFGLYITLFPQLIAGPIVRYIDVAAQIGERTITLSGAAEGVRRFILGLAKKMLIANTLAVPADAIYGLPTSDLTFGLAWLGTLCYALQIYFDFSGYSDMAIGLGKLFGFDFLENFNYPYISSSITEFWRRWHLSLSTWYRDYLYIPLGGNRGSTLRTYFNLVTVFFLCGLWHGASWNFIIWGLFHGAFLVIERMGVGRLLAQAWAPIRHGYTLLVVMVGWVFFRASTLAQAKAFLLAMVGLGHGTGIEYSMALYLNAEVLLLLAAGIIGSTPFLPSLSQAWARFGAMGERQGLPGWAWHSVLAFAPLAVLGFLLAASAMLLAAGTYNPFIYFRF